MPKNKESISFIFKIAVTLCLVCATLVSLAAVSLKGIQAENAAKEKMSNILLAADIDIEGQDINTVFTDNIEEKLISLETGEYDDSIEVNAYDQLKAAKDPSMSRLLTKDEDKAGIGRLEKLSVVYLQKKNNKLEKVILPVRGYGLWGTMYGFLALSADGKQIEGLTFYDHKETPGLGGEINNPKWQALWVGKKPFNKENDSSIKLVKGGVNPNPEIGQHQIDSIAGATLTSVGVENMVNFWLSEDGFKPFLDQLANQ